MENKTYNGWYNYETFCFFYDYEGCFNETARDFYANAEPDKLFTKDERAALDLMDYLKDFAEEEIYNITDELNNDFACDMLRSGLSEVNFHYAAVHLIDAVIEEIKYNEGELADV